jgi:6-pyruvoyltetrahydropterin/6-carboxytetrahydropterin synthase
MILRKKFRFEAAHFIQNHPGKCRNLHGHSYILFLLLEGQPDPETGMIMDFNVLSKIVQERILHQLDHKLLNDLIDPPTAENISVWIWDRLQSDLPSLVQLELFETHENGVIYRGNGHPGA